MPLLAYVEFINDAPNVHSLYAIVATDPLGSPLPTHWDIQMKEAAKGQEVVAVTLDGVTWTMLLSQLMFFMREKPGESHKASMAGHIYHSCHSPAQERLPICANVGHLCIRAGRQ
jgi:hypothetical protein